MSPLEGVVVAAEVVDEPLEVAGLPVVEHGGEALATRQGHLVVAGDGTGGQRHQLCATVARVGLARHEPELLQMRDVTTHRALVGLEGLHEGGRTLRALAVQIGAHGVLRRRHLGVEQAGPLGHHAPQPAHEHAHLGLESDQIARVHRASVAPRPSLGEPRVANVLRLIFPSSHASSRNSSTGMPVSGSKLAEYVAAPAWSQVG